MRRFLVYAERHETGALVYQCLARLTPALALVVVVFVLVVVVAAAILM